ncbi:MAG: chromosome segregation protein SMC, partial [Methylophilaceae bacterium]
VEREKLIKADVDVAKSHQAQLQADLLTKEATVQALAEQIKLFKMTAHEDLSARQQIETGFQSLRDSVVQADKLYQESIFNLKLINNNINNLNIKFNVIDEEKKTLLLRKMENEQALNLVPMEALKANLTQAINHKQLRETSLAAARNLLAEQESQLQDSERLRMQNEQQLHPLRDNLEQSRLTEQETRLYFEQCQASLLENGLNEGQLAETLVENTNTSTLLIKTNQLQQDIEALGPVNLAAIQELEVESERKGYLDSQILDLTQASQTLDDAIRKIDRETRDKLMQTFNSANQHFAELFATLFGGGQAKLELLGEEILDTGLQVFAQPPGKKNTTIQLLSGGEKALTALALVFALFRLNPAPFCLMDEVDAPLDDSNTERFCAMVKKMAEKTQFLFVSHNKITMEMAQQLIGVTMQESGVSRIVDVDIEAAIELQG